LTRLAAGEHLWVTLDQLLENILSVVRRLMHRDVPVAVSKIDLAHAASVSSVYSL
jgi:hypothetical protein